MDAVLAARGIGPGIPQRAVRTYHGGSFMHFGLHVSGQGSWRDKVSAGLPFGHIKVKKGFIIPCGSPLHAHGGVPVGGEDHAFIAVPGDAHVVQRGIGRGAGHREAVHVGGEFLGEIQDVALFWLPIGLRHVQIAVHPFFGRGIFPVPLQGLRIHVQVQWFAVEVLDHLGVPDLPVLGIAELHRAVRKAFDHMFVHRTQVRRQLILLLRLGVRHPLVETVRDARVCLRALGKHRHRRRQ